jgi:hypothetical protein
MQSRLEQYLEEVSHPLPVSKRIEWRSEAEQHLVALVAAYEELGHSHEEAMELAIEKFGDANRLGSQMRSETEKSTFPLALKVATALFCLQGLMCWFLSIPRFLRNGGQNEALLVWGAPALFIALGLLRRSPFWRKAAIVLVCTTLFGSIPFTLMTPEHFVRGEEPLIAGFRILAYVVAPAWQLWVLTRPGIKALFDRSEPRRRLLARR